MWSRCSMCLLVAALCISLLPNLAAASDRDFYAIMGLEKTATLKEIKKQFRVLARKHHPDHTITADMTEAESEAIREHFKDINAAYATLSDEEKRKAYDRFGEDNDGHGKRQGPFHGEEYDWRSRSHDGFYVAQVSETTGDILLGLVVLCFALPFARKYKLAKEKAKQKADEAAKESATFVAALKKDQKAKGALKEDAWAAEQTAKREEEIAKKQAEREKAKEEKRKKEEAAKEAARRADADRKAKIKAGIADFEAKVLSYLRTSGALDEKNATKLLRDDSVRQPNVVWMFSRCTTVDDAKSLYDQVTQQQGSEGKKKAGNAAAAAVTSVVERFNDALTALEGKLGTDRFGEPVQKASGTVSAAKKNEARSTKVEDAQWEDSDLLHLQKAMVQFPGGTMERWKKIAHFLKNKFTEEQVLAKAKQLEKDDAAAALLKRTQMPTLPKGEHGVTCSNNVASTASSPSVSPSESKKPTPKAVSNEEAVPDDWTEKQQRQLETGLREQKDYRGKDKFERVAKLVDGKTGRECYARFKYLCSLQKK